MAAAVLAAGGPDVWIYALAVISTAAFTVFRPAHSALLPALCTTPLELTSANVVRGLLDSVKRWQVPWLRAAPLLRQPGSGLLDNRRILAPFRRAALEALVRGAAARGAAALRRIVHETAEGFRALLRYRDAGVLIGLALAQTLTRGFFNVVVVVALDLLGTGAPGVGVLTAAVGAGAVASSLGASVFVGGRRLAILEGIGVMLSAFRSL